ncbi:MAG: AAA family ATPase, partial [Myxococcales bacterium]|nr:AAA family ATPase [Myxococcales bacterium]
PARTDSRIVTGTPVYMAPEQAAQKPSTAASDWYSLGAMMYEAISGDVPFRGSLLQILAAKQSEEAPDLRALAPDCPEDLALLCMALLRRRPEARPLGAAILARLGGERSGPMGARARMAELDAEPLIGRDAELGRLRCLAARAAEGHAIRLLVRGTSGIGKSALIEHFLDTLGGETLVLRGRCYEREAVPFKALDAVIDKLSRQLLSLEAEEVALLTPRDAAALALLFPVLERVPTFADAPRQVTQLSDRIAVRNRGLAALRELLSRISDRRPLIVFIDDVQWGDADSARAIDEIFATEEAPGILLVMACRAEDEGASPLLGALRDRTLAEIETLSLGPLPAAEALALARTAMGPGASEEALGSVLREAGGSPFFLSELGRHASTAGGALSGSTDLQRLIEARLRGQHEGNHCVLRTISISARGAQWNVLARACALEGPALARAIKELCDGRLARLTGAEATRLEPYHDRIREAVVETLSDAERAGLHRDLANALRAEDVPDPEALFEHCMGGGMREAAGRYAREAAQRAAGTMAFDRAAQLYRAAVDLCPGGEEEQALRIALGEALAHGGRGPAAAKQFLAVAPHVDLARRLELRRRAGEQYLFAGHVARGLAVIDSVLLELRLPRLGRRWRAILGIVGLTIRLELMPWRIRPSSRPSMDLSAALRVDALRSTAEGLAAVDPLQGLYFTLRHTLMAAKLGDPARAAAACMVLASLLSSRGHHASARVERWFDRGKRAAARSDDRRLQSLEAFVETFILTLRGEWRLAHGRLRVHEEPTQRLTMSQVMGGITQHFYILSLGWLGRLRELRLQHPRVLQSAIDRGDLYTATGLRGATCALAWLAADELEEARENAEQTLLEWRPETFDMLHWYAVEALALCERYDDRPAEALARIEAYWKPFHRARFGAIQNTWIVIRLERAKCHLALASRSASKGEAASAPHCRQARRWSRRIRRDGAAWAIPHADLLDAGAAAATGAPEEAAALCRRALGGFQEAGLALHQACAELRLGRLIGGSEGRSLLSAGAAYMQAEGVVRPEKLLRAIAPGFADPGPRLAALERREAARASSG